MTTRKILIVKEGSGYASWMAELVSKIYEQGFNDLILKRFHNTNLIPSSFKGEIEILPNKSIEKNYIFKLI
jgi:pyruvate/2-oxoglutarate/acetoin dehydrogenase E1 component